MTEPDPNDPVALALALADHEARLDDLERARWPVAGIAALTASAGVLVAVWEPASR
ncbi:hypothetical protein [Streptomyces sp. NPDC058583]|uniref:hypothetical protein n=1 Tax=unclassified Streptomyces TaxID=2593676 RepID=UPI00364E2AB9